MQEVLAWGCFQCGTSATNTGPSLMTPLSELGDIVQISCAETCLLALTKSGKVYKTYYMSESQVMY